MALKSLLDKSKRKEIEETPPEPIEESAVVEEAEEAPVEEEPKPKSIATKRAKKPEPFKVTKTTKSMTWNQKVATFNTDLEEGRKRGISIGSILASRITAVASGVKSISDSTVGMKRHWYKTSLLPLDYAFGKGKGIPSGAVIEFFGPEMGGKTTALMAVAGVLQRRYDALVVIADTEASIDDSTIARANLLQDPSHLMVLEAPAGHVKTVQFVFNNFMKIIEQYSAMMDSMEEDEQESAPPLVLLWDSVGGTPVTDVDLDDDSGTAGSGRIGLAAKVIGDNIQKAKELIRKKNVIFLVCNQQRAIINMTPGKMSYGDTEKPAGGYAWQHYTDVRFRVRHRNPWGKNYAGGSTRITTNKDEILGNIMYLENRKNKASAPFRVCALINIFDMGVDVVQSNVLHAAFDLADSPLVIFKRMTGIYRWRDFEGTLPNLIELLREDEELHLQFQEDVRSAQMKSLTPNLPPPEDLDEDSTEDMGSDDSED